MTPPAHNDVCARCRHWRIEHETIGCIAYLGSPTMECQCARFVPERKTPVKPTRDIMVSGGEHETV